MKKHDRVGGFIWLVLGMGICIGAIKLRLGTLLRPGPGFMPFLSGAIMGVFGLILVFSTGLTKLGEVKSETHWVKGNLKNLLLPSLAIFGYVLLLEPLGFLITTFIFLIFLLKLKEPKRWAMPLILTASTVALSYLIFSVWLKCQFPRGILSF